MTIRLLLSIFLASAFSASAANVRTYFVNPDGDTADTNIYFITAIGSNVLSGGGVITRGVPLRVTPRSDGVATNSLSIGHYAISNRFLGQGLVMRVPLDTGSTVYDYTNLLISGYNTFVTIEHGTNDVVTSNEITNALGYVPAQGIETTNNLAGKAGTNETRAIIFTNSANTFGGDGAALTGIPQAGVSGLPAALGAKANTNTPVLYYPTIYGINTNLPYSSNLNIFRTFVPLTNHYAGRLAYNEWWTYGSQTDNGEGIYSRGWNHSPTGHIDTNFHSFLENVELNWDPSAPSADRQIEYYLEFTPRSNGSPARVFGLTLETNFMDARFNADYFGVADPYSNIPSFSVDPARDNDSAVMILKGIFKVRTNAASGGQVVLEGGQLQHTVPSGFTASFVVSGVDWDNGQGVRPDFFLHSTGTSKAWTTTGFTNINFTRAALALSNGTPSRVMMFAAGSLVTNVGHADILKGDGSAAVSGTDYTTLAQLQDSTNTSRITFDAEWDSIGEIETAIGAANILLETEIDASSELAALMDDETGSGGLVFSNAPSIRNPSIAGTLYADALEATNGSAMTLTAGGVTMTIGSGAVSVGTPYYFSQVVNPYNATTWNGSTRLATEDDVRDKIESMSVSSGYHGWETNTAAANSYKSTNNISTDGNYGIGGNLNITGSLVGNGGGLTNLQNTAVQYPTNVAASATTPAFSLTGGVVYQDLSTNATFQFLAPSGISTTNYQTCVKLVTNSLGTLIAMIAPANCHTQGTWNATSVTAVTFFNNAGRWTNAIATPLW